jgi:hypothetical protein
MELQHRNPLAEREDPIEMANPPKSKTPTKPARPDGSSKPNGQPPRISATVDGGVSGANRKERKDEARRQREALLRKQERRKFYRLGAVGVAAVLVLVLVLVFTLFKKTPVASGKSFDQANLPGLITSQDVASWSRTPNTQDLAARIKDLGLPALTASEQLAFHIHQELEIFIDGVQVDIPALIGIDEADSRISMIHVHQTSGLPDDVIHVESPVQRTFTLGDFFGVWGMNFTPTAIGGFQNLGGKTLQAYVNGTLFNGNITKIPLLNHEVIVVTYGTPAQLPNPIPTTFDWATSTAGG